MWCHWSVALILALVAPLVLIMEEKSVDLSYEISGEYNLVELSSPALAGPPIRVAAWIMAKSPLSPYIMRHLLEKNGVRSVRSLAAKLPDSPPKYFPLHHLTKVELERHTIASKAYGAGLLNDWPNQSLHQELRHPDQFPFWSIMDYHRMYKSGRTTPSEQIDRVLQGCDKLAHLHVFSSFLPDDVRQQAKESDLRWKEQHPLSVFDGVPVVVKDMLKAAGHRLCNGGSVCETAPRNDILVERLRQAGAILLGISVTTEGGVTPLGYAKFFDGPFNAYNPNYYPGGSSSGSGVAVASGLVPMAIGLDGGGSIRVPAAMSGVVGLAPTCGRILFDGRSTFVTNAKAGPIAGTVEDIALSYLLLGQIEESHVYPSMINNMPPPHLEGIVRSSDATAIRLGIFWDHFKDTDPEVLEASLKVVRYLESQGAELVNVTIPHLQQLHMAHAIKITSEFGINWEKAFFDKSVEMEGNTEVMVALGRTVTAAEVLAAEKLRSFGIDHLCKKLFQQQKLDAIVSPSLGLKVPKPMKGYRGYGESNVNKVGKVMKYMPLANFLGLPALSINAGYDSNGMPIGFQLLGDAWTENKLIRIASVIEKGFASFQRRPPSTNFFDALAF